MVTKFSLWSEYKWKQEKNGRKAKGRNLNQTYGSEIQARVYPGLFAGLKNSQLELMFVFPLDSSYFRIIIIISRPNIGSADIWPEIVGTLISNPAISKGRSGIPENRGLRETCLFAKVRKPISLKTTRM